MNEWMNEWIEVLSHYVLHSCTERLVILKPNFLGYKFTNINVTRFKVIVVIIIIIIIIIILGISFMQGIYTYIPEKNHFPREHCVAAILM